MASEFDELIEQLLYALAVAGESGLGRDALLKHAGDFYSSRHGDTIDTTQPNEVPLLFSDEPPNVRPSIDEAFVQNLWNCMTRLKDVSTITLDHLAESNVVVDTERLVTTQERIWQALAGHSVDYSRIKRAEFTLLQIIAQHGASGIIQPDLVRESGQDKRSVPKRTDQLARNGYISKSAIIAAGTRTSLLKLLRFADQIDQFPDSAVPHGRGVIFYDLWFDKLSEMMKKHNGVVAVEDIRIELGINELPHETRALNRCIRRLMAADSIKRVRGRIAGRRDGDVDAYANCIKLLRPLTELERKHFKSQSSKGPVKQRKPNKPAVQQDTIHDNQSDDDGDIDDGDFELEEQETGDTATRSSDIARVPPQWTPDLPITNFLYDMIEAGGPTGVSTMEIHFQALGPAMRRPIDEIMLRLCDYWRVSQPSHLRHMGIIKDTAIDRRTHYFLYRTRPAFETAVANGAAYWEAIDSEVAQDHETLMRDLSPSLDAWGFPVLDPDLFAGRQDGMASLAIGERHARQRDSKSDKAATSRKVTTKRTLPVSNHITQIDLDEQIDGDASLEIDGEASDQHDDLNEEAEDFANNESNAIEIEQDEKSTQFAANTLVSAMQQAKQSDHASSTQQGLCMINPPGAYELMRSIMPHRVGRAKQSAIAVFKLPALNDLSWFMQQFHLPSISTKRKRGSKDSMPIAAKRSRREDSATTNLLDIVTPIPEEVSPQYRLYESVISQEQPDNTQSPVMTAHETVLNTAKSPADHREISPVKTSTSTLESTVSIRRAKYIMDMVEKCGGVYPGNREIHGPMRAAFKQSTKSGLDVVTMDNTVRDLVRRGRLRKVVFQFYDEKALLVRKAVLTMPHIELGDPKIRAMQVEIEKAHPSRYLPPIENDENGMSADMTKPQTVDFRHETATQQQVEPVHIVQRTEQGLAAMAKRREELLAKLGDRPPRAPIRPYKRRPALIRQESSSEEGSDSDNADDISPEQARLMSKFQLTDYKPSFAHAQQPHMRYTSGHHGWADNNATGSRPQLRMLSRLESFRPKLLIDSFKQTAYKSLRSVPGVQGPRKVLRSAPRQPRESQLIADQISGVRFGPQSLSIDEQDEDVGLGLTVTKKRDRRSPKLFVENDRLANAVALYRATVGGLDQRCNWGVIAHMFNFRYEPDFLRRRWDVMKNAREQDVRSMLETIHAPFLEAYERDEVPLIDFTDLGKTDWAALLEWVERTVLTSRALLRDQINDLPQDPDAFNAAYKVCESSDVWEKSRDSWFTLAIDKARKDTAHEFVYGTPLPGHHRPVYAQTENDLLVLMTLIRAITVTPANKYRPTLAAEKLQGFRSDQISAACEELLANKTLRHLNKGRHQPGRNYEVHDTTWSAFRRWPGKEAEWKYLRQVAEARERILDSFDQHPTIELSYLAPDSDVLVLLSMVHQGFLKIASRLPERNDSFEAPFPKISAWGYAGYSYNAKTLDRERLRFPVMLEKADELEREHGLTPGVAIPLQTSKFSDGRVAFWTDIEGELVPDIWDAVLRSVLHLAVYRTGIGVPAIVDAHDQRLAGWEIELVLDWMLRSGIVEPYGPGEVRDGGWTGGWKATEWWYCAFCPDMITWYEPRNEQAT